MSPRPTSPIEKDNLTRLLLNMTRVPQNIGKRVVNATPLGKPFLVIRPFDYFSRPTLFPRPIYGDTLYLTQQDLPEGANAYLAGQPCRKSLFDDVIISVQPYKLEFE